MGIRRKPNPTVMVFPVSQEGPRVSEKRRTRSDAVLLLASALGPHMPSLGWMARSPALQGVNSHLPPDS